ncbi:MAG: tetratricopeptide repeat protein [Lachnospiraceae bacterium]|nr:tetratricopeptide repeat protein [Lachnospiraceae bacterium]
MFCYKCGAELSEKDFCTNCGADVRKYKKIIYRSNSLYNDGLEKAEVRDLSGAVISLRQCLKLNKDHVEARNLLGLVYFECGEIVEALTEWVISKNIRPQKNIADDYINIVQSDQQRLASLNQAVKKYNQAVEFCEQDSLDYAKIQLKKVVGLNPKFVKAQQLLALLYMQNDEWESAKKALKRCLKVDVNNTTTLRYLKEASFMTEGEESPIKKPRKGVIAKDSIVIQHGNETIIQPNYGKNPIGGSSNLILHILIGIGIGALACYFLVVPAVVQSTKNSMNEEIRQISENSDSKSADITDLEQRVAALSDENQKLQEQLGSYTGEGGALQTVDGLMNAAQSYLNNPEDLTTVSEILYQIDKDYVAMQGSTAYQALYEGLMAKVGGEVASINLENGIIYKNQGDYTTAVEKLEKAWYFNPNDPEILYTLAETYQQSGNMDKANELYNQLVMNFPDSEYSDMSERNIASAATGGSVVEQENPGAEEVTVTDGN